jgi:hypothetical protein
MDRSEVVVDIHWFGDESNNLIEILKSNPKITIGENEYILLDYKELAGLTRFYAKRK